MWSSGDGPPPFLRTAALFAAGFPECFRVVKVVRYVGRVRASGGREAEGFRRIHLRTHRLDERVIGVAKSDGLHPLNAGGASAEDGLAASWLLEAGWPIHYVQHILGPRSRLFATKARTSPHNTQ